MPLKRRQIAWRAAQDLVDGAYVNLGIGLPTLVSDFIPPDREIVLHSENGVLGVGPAPGGIATALGCASAAPRAQGSSAASGATRARQRMPATPAAP